MKKDGFMSMTLIYTFLILFLFIMLAILNAYNHENRYLEAIETSVKEKLKQTSEKDDSLLNKIISDNNPQNDGPLNFGVAGTTAGLYFTSAEDSGDENNDKSGRRLYYYRGAVTNNYVQFAGYCWRIIRTTENGGIKLLYHNIANGNKCNNEPNAPIKNVVFNNEVKSNNTDVGYMFGTPTSVSHYGYNFYDSTHANNTATLAKRTLESWYENNIANKPLTTTSKIINTIYCNDRSLGAEGTVASISYGEYGFSTFPTLYGSTRRNATNGAYGTTFTSEQAMPTFKCMQINDQFTLSESLGGAAHYGNNDLSYPVGFLTLDEIVYAGGGYNLTNTSYYLQKYTGWTMTPMRFAAGNAHMFTLGASGKVETKAINTTTSDNIVPVIAISSDILVINGSGTSTDPYILEENVDE